MPPIDDQPVSPTMKRCYAPVRPCPEGYVVAAMDVMNVLPDEWGMVVARPEMGVHRGRRAYWMVFVVTQRGGPYAAKIDVLGDNLLTMPGKVADLITTAARSRFSPPPPPLSDPLPEDA